MSVVGKLKSVHQEISRCRACPGMCGTPVHGPAIETSVMLLGQAPGVHEATFGRPFAYTAGKTLFKWFNECSGVDEDTFRSHVYIAATARCFPGKAGKGDRIPSDEEILNCRQHLKKEVALLKPKLLIAVGRVAIREALGPERFLKTQPLADVVGKTWKVQFQGITVDVICLPHPSGRSTWHVTEPGKTLLRKSLKLIANHSEWLRVVS